MLSYILSRFVALALSLVVASLVIFVMIELVPGDPASFMLGLNAAPDTVAALRAELGLGGSPVERYLRWVGGMLQGDFGTSYTYRAPVAELVTARLAVSLPLALMALLLSTLIAIPVGLYAASRRGRPGDWSFMGLTQLGIAIPNFWFAMILVVIFAINLRWFSAGGFPGWDQGIWPSLKALTLPAVALALPQASILARVMRSAVLEVLGQLAHSVELAAEHVLHLEVHAVALVDGAQQLHDAERVGAQLHEGGLGGYLGQSGRGRIRKSGHGVSQGDSRIEAARGGRAERA